MLRSLQFGFLLLAVSITCSLIAHPAKGYAATVATQTPQNEVINLVNSARNSTGLPALRYNAALSSSANAYAAYMASAGFFSHVGPDGSTLVTRAEAAGYVNWTWLGEDLAAGQSSASSVVAAWMASPPHAGVILSTGSREIGAGFATGGSYGYYWVLELGARWDAPVFGYQVTISPVERHR